MSYQISVLFESPSRPVPFTFCDVITQDDWTCMNYWDDIGDRTSLLIRHCEKFLRDMYPKGHDYNLSTVNISYLGDDEE